MTPQERIIAHATSVARQATGSVAPEAVMLVLATMLLEATRGASAGFLRAPPASPTELKVDDHEPL